MTTRSPVSVIVVTYNSAEFLGRTLSVLNDDPLGPAQIVVVDNGSTDDTLPIAQAHGVTLVQAPSNDGYGTACNLGAQAAEYDTLAFLTPDTVPSPGWLPPLVGALQEGVGAAMATIELLDQPGHFNTSGGVLTYVGLAWVSDNGVEIPENEEVSIVPWPSGAAFAIPSTTFAELNGFREDLFMYHEDTDLGWRLAMRGLPTLRIPQSRVAHAYEFDRNGFKMGYLERNRWRLLRTNYRFSTLVALSPALAISELGVTVVALRDGWFSEKARMWGDLLVYRPRSSRRGANIDRVVGDAALLSMMSPSVRPPIVDQPKGTGVVDWILRTWLAVVLPAIRFRDRQLGLRV